MIRAISILVATFLPIIFIFSAVGLHIEIFIKNGFAFHAGQLSFPAIVMPLDFMEKGGISIALIIAAGLGAGLHHLVFKKIIVQQLGWVSDVQYSRLFSSDKK